MKVNLIQAQRILSPTQINIAPYTINPYRGCPLGCLYCYAQENKSIKKNNLHWGKFIDIKVNALDLLKDEIENKSISRVLLGSTVECYPPQERDFLITKNIIKILNEKNIPVTILTKSCLIERDLNLISKFSDNKIYFTINFDSEKTKNLFEPNSPSIKERLEILRQIKQLNINNRVYIGPLFPYIQNIEELCIMVEKYTQEIAIELYNFKMGNWSAIEEIIRDNLPPETYSKINQLFSCKKNYDGYRKELKSKIGKISIKINKKIIFLSPEFKDYYRNDMIYE